MSGCDTHIRSSMSKFGLIRITRNSSHFSDNCVDSIQELKAGNAE